MRLACTTSSLTHTETHFLPSQNIYNSNKIIAYYLHYCNAMDIICIARLRMSSGCFWMPFLYGFWNFPWNELALFLTLICVANFLWTSPRVQFHLLEEFFPGTFWFGPLDRISSLAAHCHPSWNFSSPWQEIGRSSCLFLVLESLLPELSVCLLPYLGRTPTSSGSFPEEWRGGKQFRTLHIWMLGLWSYECFIIYDPLPVLIFCGV